MHHLEAIVLVLGELLKHWMVKRPIEECEMFHIRPCSFYLHAFHTSPSQMDQLPEVLPWSVQKVESKVMRINNLEVAGHAHAVIMQLM